MNNNLVLKITIGALIVAVAGLTVRLTMVKPSEQTNVTEIPTTTITLASATTATTISSNISCLDINKYAIPKQADTADIKIIQKALGVTPIGGNCGPKTQSALGDFRNNYGYHYGMGNTVCLLSQEVVIAFNEKYCNQITNKSSWINETPLAETALKTFFNLAATKNYIEAQKYFWISNSNATWLYWKDQYHANGYRDSSTLGAFKYMYENGGSRIVKEILQSEQMASNTYKFTIRLVRTNSGESNGKLVDFGPCCGASRDPATDYAYTTIIVRKIGDEFLVSDGIYWRS